MVPFTRQRRRCPPSALRFLGWGKVSTSSASAFHGTDGRTAGVNPFGHERRIPADKRPELDGCRHPACVGKTVNVSSAAAEQASNSGHVQEFGRSVGRRKSSGHTRSFRSLRRVVRRTLRQSKRALRSPETGPNRTILPMASNRLEVFRPVALRKNGSQNRISRKNPVWSGLVRFDLDAPGFRTDNCTKRIICTNSGKAHECAKKS